MFIVRAGRRWGNKTVEPKFGTSRLEQASRLAKGGQRQPLVHIPKPRKVSCTNPQSVAHIPGGKVLAGLHLLSYGLPPTQFLQQCIADKTQPVDAVHSVVEVMTLQGVAT